MNYQQEIAGSFPDGAEANEACIRKIAQKTLQQLLIYPKRLQKVKETHIGSYYFFKTQVRQRKERK